MAVKFSQFTSGSVVGDIDFIVGYKSTDNVRIPIGLVTANTTYSISSAQSGSNENITLTGSDASTDSLLVTAGSNITLTDEALDFLVDKGYDKKMGARPLQRIIDTEIKRPLSKEMLFGKLKNGGDCAIVCDDDKLNIKVTKKGKYVQKEV